MFFFNKGKAMRFAAFRAAKKLSTPRVSARGDGIAPSPIRKLAPLYEEACAQGKTVYTLNIGQPDIKTPKEYFEALQSFSASVVKYENSKGSSSLCQAWSAYLNTWYDLETSAEHFLITSGASEALYICFAVCFDAGDEILVIDPTYANFGSIAAPLDLRFKAIPTKLEDNFSLPSRSEIEKAISSRCKGILICTPNNPTGTVYSKEELRLLLDLAHEHGLYLIVDETYREFVYDGHEACSIFQLASQDPHLIVIDSLSKRFSLCGARIGAIITSNQEVRAVALKIAQARLSVSTVEQFAAAYLLQHISEDFLRDAVSEYAKRRNVMLSLLRSIKGVSTHTPHGAFYCIAKLPLSDAEAFAAFLLRDFSDNNESVYLAPASGFYLGNGRGKDEVRLAYVLQTEHLESALRCLEAGLQAYASRS